MIDVSDVAIDSLVAIVQRGRHKIISKCPDNPGSDPYFKIRLFGMDNSSSHHAYRVYLDVITDGFDYAVVTGITANKFKPLRTEWIPLVQTAIREYLSQ